MTCRLWRRAQGTMGGRTRTGPAVSVPETFFSPLVKYLTTAFHWLDATKQPWSQLQTSNYNTANHNLQYSRFLWTRECFCLRNRHVTVIKSKMAFARPKYAWLQARPTKSEPLFGSPACLRLQYVHRSWKLSEFARGLGRERAVTAPFARSRASLFHVAFPLSESQQQNGLSTHLSSTPNGLATCWGRGTAKRRLTL